MNKCLYIMMILIPSDIGVLVAVNITNFHYAHLITIYT